MMVDILLIFSLVIICIVSWLIANVIWTFIQGKLMVRILNQKMDAVYAKLVRLLIQAKKDFKNGGSNNDNL